MLAQCFTMIGTSIKEQVYLIILPLLKKTAHQSFLAVHLAPFEPEHRPIDYQQIISLLSQADMHEPITIA